MVLEWPRFAHSLPSDEVIIRPLTILIIYPVSSPNSYRRFESGRVTRIGREPGARAAHDSMVAGM